MLKPLFSMDIASAHLYAFAALLIVSPASAVDFGKPFGWTVPLEYAAPVIATAAIPGVRIGDRVFTMREASSIQWKERAVISELGAVEAQDTAAYLAAESGRDSIGCADFSKARIFDDPLPDGGHKIVEIWVCPQDATTGRGRVSMQSVLVNANAGIRLATLGDYPPFPPGRSVVPKEQEKRWLDFSKHLSVCSGFDNPSCWPETDAMIRADVATVSGDEQTTLETIERRGTELYRQDQLAWHATDIVKADPRVEANPVTAGWIATPTGERAGEVVFFKQDGTHAVPLWRVQFDETGKATHELLQAPAQFSTLATQVRAVQTATNAYASRCKQPINHSIMRNDDGEGWIVYLMPSTNETDIVLLGDAARIFVSADGQTVIRQEALAKSCRNFNLALAAKEGMLHSIPTSQVVSPYPGEDHILATLTFDITFYVGTPKAIWRIDHGKISKLGYEWKVGVE